MINVVDLSKSWKIKIVMWKKYRQNEPFTALLECKQFFTNFLLKKYCNNDLKANVMAKRPMSWPKGQGK